MNYRSGTGQSAWECSVFPQYPYHSSYPANSEVALQCNMNKMVEAYRSVGFNINTLKTEVVFKRVDPDILQGQSHFILKMRKSSGLIALCTLAVCGLLPTTLIM